MFEVKTELDMIGLGILSNIDIKLRFSTAERLV